MKKHKKTLKIFLYAIAILILATIIFIGWSLFGSITKNNIKYYNELTEKNVLMPPISNIGDYEDLRFQYYHKNMLFFESDSYSLVAKYDANTYLEQKDILDEKYVFQEKNLPDMKDVDKKPMFSIGTFNFRLLCLDTYKDEDLIYPKKMVFIGTSDNDYEIAYIYFQDLDLDYIDTSFENFLKEYCKWK